MRDASAQEQELQGILSVIDGISSADAALIADSSSSAKRKRGKPPPAEARAYREELQRKVVDKREEIGLLWAKINELQERERELEKQNQ